MAESTHGDIVLGGGVAGLAAAWTAREAGVTLPVYEAAAHGGGLLAGFEHEGWRFDHGVHLSFASEPEVRAVFDRTPYIEHDAVALNWDRGHWLRHPVQNHMHPLPLEEKVALIHSVAQRRDIEVHHYRDWLVHQYGNEVAERWPLTYTRKYWTLPAEQLGTAWIGSRMRTCDLREVLRGAMDPDPPPTYYVSRMRYPLRGGYGAFLDPLLEDVVLHGGHRAVAVDRHRRELHFDNGRTVPWRRLVSTIPLPALVAMMNDVPADVAEAAGTLFATAMDLVSVGVARPDLSPSLWFYIYDEDILAARAYSPSRKSPNNAPPGCSSLQFEIYSSPRRPQAASREALVENCLYALEKMGLARRDEVLFTHHRHVPYANVVFDLGMEARRDLVRRWVQDCGIVLAGRFGEWDYLWSNQAFMSGRRAALSLR